MKICLFRFRPSSHSVDLTIYAVFENGEKARKAFEAAKRFLNESEFRFDDFRVGLQGRAVYIRTPTSLVIRDLRIIFGQMKPLIFDVKKRVPKLIKTLDGVKGNPVKWRKAGGKLE